MWGSGDVQQVHLDDRLMSGCCCNCCWRCAALLRRPQRSAGWEDFSEGVEHLWSRMKWD